MHNNTNKIAYNFTISKTKHYWEKKTTKRKGDSSDAKKIEKETKENNSKSFQTSYLTNEKEK